MRAIAAGTPSSMLSFLQGRLHSESAEKGVLMLTRWPVFDFQDGWEGASTDHPEPHRKNVRVTKAPDEVSRFETEPTTRRS